jgi:hypothetical protein
MEDAGSLGWCGTVGMGLTAICTGTGGLMLEVEGVEAAVLVLEGVAVVVNGRGV